MPHTPRTRPYSTISRARMLDAGELQAAYNGAVRMHIECPKHTKFVIPLGWTTIMTSSDKSPREVVTNRYVNVHPIGEDKYQNCCGTIKGQGPPDNKGHIYHGLLQIRGRREEGSDESGCASEA